MPVGAHQGAYLRLETRPDVPGTPQRIGAADPDDAGTLCGNCFRLLVDCFKGRDVNAVRRDEGSRSVHDRVATQYQAPVVAPLPHAASSSSLGECDHEQGTLLPKRATPEPGAGSSGMAAGAAAGAAVGAAAGTAAAAGLDSMLQELPRHLRTGSGPSSARPFALIDGAPAVLPVRSGAVAAVGDGRKPSGTTGLDSSDVGGSGASSSQLAKGSAEPLAGKRREAAADADLLRGAMGGGEEEEGEEDDCCATCLEPYTEGNPRIWTRCGHHFHMQCICSWWERKETCPLCESRIEFEGM